MAKDLTQSKKYVWPAIGNEKAIEFLNRSLESDKIAQTYVFIGPEDLGKSTIALAFARNLQGDYDGFNSDLYILDPETGSKGISIDQVREFIKMLNLSSFLNSYKIGLIKEADLLSEEAKSALLKTLEEPKEKVIIILLVASEESLPATILSRSQKLYFYPVPASTVYGYLVTEYGANRSLAKDLASLSLGRPLKALRYLDNPEVYKTYLIDAEKFLSIFGLDANARLKVLDFIFSDRTYSRQATDQALSFLLMAEGLLRDLMLMSLEQKDHLQHLVLSEALTKSLHNLEGEGEEKTKGILNRLRLISQAREYIDANVNPRLVLEQLFFNL